MPGAEARGVPLPGDIDPDADDLVRDTLVAEAADGHAVHLIDSRGEVALPGGAVGRGRGRDLDREMRAEALHHGAGVRLGPAGHVPVPLHDYEQARTAQFATRSTSCSRRASNAGQVHSRSTYLRPDSPSASRFAITPWRARAKPARSHEAPPFALATCPPGTLFFADTRQGVPTCHASRRTMPRLSRCEGSTSTSAASRSAYLSSSLTRPSDTMSSRSGTGMRTVPARTSEPGPPSSR